MYMIPFCYPIHYPIHYNHYPNHYRALESYCFRPFSVVSLHQKPRDELWFHRNV